MEGVLNLGAQNYCKVKESRSVLINKIINKEKISSSPGKEVTV